MTSRMREIRKSGSVGAQGEQSPWATRPQALTASQARDTVEVGSRLSGGQQSDESPSPNKIVKGETSKFLTIKHAVEFVAALIAVIGGIVAFIRLFL
jgi:hypothetical protein